MQNLQTSHFLVSFFLFLLGCEIFLGGLFWGDGVKGMMGGSQSNLEVLYYEPICGIVQQRRPSRF